MAKVHARAEKRAENLGNSPKNLPKENTGLPSIPLAVVPNAAAQLEPEPTLVRQRMSDIPDDYAAPKDLIDGVLCPGDATMIFAPPGCQKSYFLFQLALALATGEQPFHGAANLKNLRAGQRTRVLFVTSEMGLRELQRRHGVDWKRRVVDRELKEHTGARLEWCIVLPVNRVLTPGADRSSPLDNIRAELDAAKLDGYPVQAVIIDNVTTLWPGMLSDNKDAARLAEDLKTLCSEDGEYFTALAYAMHLNKLPANMKYENVAASAMKGNAFFEIVTQRAIGFNESTTRTNGVYMVELKNRWKGKGETYHRKRVATFVVKPDRPNDDTSPSWQYFDGISTEDAERGREESTQDIVERWMREYLTKHPASTYKEFHAAFQAHFPKNEAPGQTKFRDTRNLCARATGRDELKMSVQ